MKRARPNLNRCAGCKEKREFLVRMPDMEMKGTYCEKCADEVRVLRKLGRICVHGKGKDRCQKKACLARHVMES